MIKNHTIAPGTNQKLLTKFKGPYLVKKVLDKNRYVVSDIPGYQLSQKPYEAILSPDRMKAWIKSSDPVEVDLSDTFMFKTN